jgi:hypothetical protein
MQLPDSIERDQGLHCRGLSVIQKGRPVGLAIPVHGVKLRLRQICEALRLSQSFTAHSSLLSKVRQKNV